MKKKLSILGAAVIAVSSIAITSAHATPLAVTVNGSANATTSNAPQSVAVPATNVIDAGHSVAIAATADTSTAVNFTASSNVKLVSTLNTGLAPVTVGSGTSSASVVSTGSTITEYAYTTSAAIGTVLVSNGSYSTIVYIQGTASSAYNISIATSPSAAVNTAPSVTVNATDLFGNPVGNEAITVTLVGAVFADSSVSKVLTTSPISSNDGTLVLGSAKSALAPLTTAAPITVIATDLL